MGFLIPDCEMTKADIKTLRSEVINELLNRAAAGMKKPKTDLVVRDIFPKEDFSDSTPAWNGVEWENQTAITAANTWTQDFTKVLGDTKFVGFYGVLSHEAASKAGGGVAEGHSIYGVKYRVGSAGGTTREAVHLQAAERDFYATSGKTRVPIGYHKPVYYDGKETINVQLISNATPGARAVQNELLGLMCEPLGEVISGGRDIQPEQTSIIIPEDELTLEEIKTFRDSLKTRLLDIAVKETGKLRSELVVRDINPLDDLGFNGIEWQNQTAIGAADTWTKDWSKELSKTKFLGFYGIDYKTCATTVAAWKYMGVSYRLGPAGPTTLKQVHLQKCQRNILTGVGTMISARGYHEPVIYKGNETAYVSLIANTTVTQYYEGIQLLGLFCEPYGETIS